MKMTIKEYRKLELRRLDWFRRLLINIWLLELCISDSNCWGSNNDYNYEIKLQYKNPIVYVLLPIYILLYLLANGFNKDSYKSLLEELK